MKNLNLVAGLPQKEWDEMEKNWCELRSSCVYSSDEKDICTDGTYESCPHYKALTLEDWGLNFGENKNA